MPGREREERDERWELASRAAQEGIWDWNLRTNKIYRSDYWFEMFGYEPGELEDTPWAWEEMIHPDDVSRVLENRRQNIQGLINRYYVEHRVRCKDGIYRWFLSRGQVIRDEQGNPVRMIGFHANIEETVRIRQSLLRQNKALHVLQKLALQAIGSYEYDLMLTELLNQAREFMSADKAYLYLHNRQEDMMRVHSLSGVIGPSILKAKRGEFIVGQVWDSGEYVYIDHFDEWEGRPPTADAGQIRTGIGVPLKLDAEMLGVVTMGFQAARTVTDDEIDILEQFAAIGAMVIHNRDKVFDPVKFRNYKFRRNIADTVELRLHLINKLLDGKPMTPRDIQVQAQQCDLDYFGGYLAMVVELPLSSDVRFEAVSCLGPNEGCGWLRNGKLFLLCNHSLDQADKKLCMERAIEILHRIRGFFLSTQYRLGMGLPFSGLTAMNEAFQQALEALSIGPRLNPGKEVYHYLDIGLIHVLSRQKERGYVDSYLKHTLGKLVEYDNKKNGHLIETLEAILQEPSLRGAADAMFIHTKTLLFRKHKIEELLGESLDDPAIRLNLMMALQLYELSQPPRIKRKKKVAESQAAD